MSSQEEKIENIGYYKKGLHPGHLESDSINLLFYTKGSSIPNIRISISSLTMAYECTLHNNFFSVEFNVNDSFYIFTGFEADQLSLLKSWVPIPFTQKEQSISSVSFGDVYLTKSLLSFVSPASRSFSDDLLSSIRLTKGNISNLEEKLEEEVEVGYKSLFDLPLNLITKCSNPYKGDIALEFVQPDFPVQDVLCEMRLSCNDGAAEICDFIQDYAPRLKITEKSYLQLNNIFIPTPRGRFSLIFYDQFLTLEGKNKQFKIPFRTMKTIIKVKNHDDKINIVIEINPAISVRQTPYQYIVFEFSKNDYYEENSSEDENEEEIEVEEKKPEIKRAKVNTEEKIEYKEKYEKFLEEILGKSKKKVVEIGEFIGSKEINGVTADVKSNNGILYFLEGYLLYLQKPIIVLRKDEIKKIEFLRWNNFAAKSFDIKVHIVKNIFLFVNIEKSELTEILDYFVGTGIFIENVEEIQKVSGEQRTVEGRRGQKIVSAGDLGEGDETEEEVVSDAYLESGSGSISDSGSEEGGKKEDSDVNTEDE